MPELTFRVESAEAVRSAAVPLLRFKLHISNASNPIASSDIANVMLQCQVQIDAPRRRYQPSEQERLRDLFGEPDGHNARPRPLLWTHVSLLVPGFQDDCVVDLPIPCSFDFNVAAVKYFYALENGAVPLLFQFSGTIFYRDEHAGLQISQIAWSKEAPFSLPVSLWQEMMDHYYPNSTWLCLDRAQFERLYRYKRQHGLPSWEQAISSLLDSVEENVP